MKLMYCTKCGAVFVEDAPRCANCHNHRDIAPLTLEPLEIDAETTLAALAAAIAKAQRGEA